MSCGESGKGVQTRLDFMSLLFCAMWQENSLNAPLEEDNSME